MQQLKNIRSLLYAAMVFTMVFITACQSGGSSDGQNNLTDTIQERRDDRSMSNQQHDGIDQSKIDSTQQADSTGSLDTSASK
ncbi:MAG TPA: hypothetical protein VL053_09450 [Arachidicoccus sp.]|nr:hypothetical protein [Arachidicoccus sp.]